MANFAPPIFVHKKKKTRTQIKRASKGKGKLAHKVAEMVAEAQAKLGANVKVVPILISYKKPKKGRTFAPVALPSILGN